MYRIHILDAAARELARLDKPVGRRIVERLNWLVASFDTVTPEPLTGELLGLYKFRHDEQILVIHAIGHCRDIHRRR
jgi:mRNA interferase RelE/StbE